MFYREKKIDCGSYREADIIPRTDSAEKAAKGRRGKSKKVSEPKQKDLNEKNSKRYLVQLGNGNFGAGDLHVTFTYSENIYHGRKRKRSGGSGTICAAWRTAGRS